MSGELAPLLIVLLLALLLYPHFRWADIDPHNPTARPGKVLTAVKSGVVVALLLTAFSLSQSNTELWATGIGAFALGMVAGPAISTPYVPREDEESSTSSRRLKRIEMLLSGSILKTLLVFALAWPASLVLPSHPVYWTTAALACVFNLSKLPVTLALSEKQTLQAAYISAGLYRKLLPVAVGGTLAVIFWYPLAFPIAKAIPAFSTDSVLSLSGFAGILGLWFGLVVSAALSG
jgi:hypothetical protein